MIPSPTQPLTQPPPPAQFAPVPSEPQRTPTDPPKVALTPTRKRVGQTPVARTIKAVLRPLIKALYYTIRWIRAHKLVALLALLLLVTSIFATSLLMGSSRVLTQSDTLKSSIESNPRISPDVQHWLLAMRDGDLNTMLAIQKSLDSSTRSPDSSMYVLQFSEKYAAIKWTKIQVSSLTQAADGMIDTFIEADLAPTGATASGATKMVALWHFTTTPAGHILLIDYVSGRAS